MAEVRVVVHATPSARRNYVGGSHDGALRVAVTAPADKGRANDAIEQELARSLGVKPSRVAIVSGHTSRRKAIAVQDPPSDLADRIQSLMEDS